MSDSKPTEPPPMKFNCLKRNPCTFAFFFAAAIFAWSGFAFAEGAIAVAEPKDVAKDGYAVGVAWNYPSREEAERAALKLCREEPASPAETRKLCKVVHNFMDQCAAVALDPDDGTPGAGWAIAQTKELAERNALQRCHETAGKERAGKCIVTQFGCDGSAK